MSLYSQYKQIFSNKGRKQFHWACFSMLAYSFFESFGLSMIIPYIGLLTKNESVLLRINNIQEYFGYQLTYPETVLYFTVFYLILISVKSLSHVYMIYTSISFCYDFFSEKSLELYKKYLNLQYEKMISLNTTSCIKNCTFIVDRVSHSLYLYVCYLSSLIMTMFLISLVLLNNFLYSILFLSFFLMVGALIYLFLKKPQDLAGRQVGDSMQAIYKIVGESLACLKEIKIYQKGEYFYQKFQEQANIYAKGMKFGGYSGAVPVVILEFLAVCVLLCVTLIFIMYGFPLEKLIGPLIFYGAVSRRLLPDIKQIFSMKVKIQQYIPHIELLKEELEQVNKASHLNENFESQKPISFEKEIELRDVTYYYPDCEKSALSHVNLSIKKNQTLAFVGPSGAGKSTLVDIIASLLMPESGQFYIDGVQHENLNGVQYRIGYVPQDVILLDDTIARNIAFGEENIDYDRLKMVMKISYIDEFVEELPEKENTLVGERGAKLSGGQKQRVGIARSLYFNPEILIFDEATSALDSHSEHMISKAIDEISGQVTVIAIAHRMTTIKDFDQIVVLDQGEVVGVGRHNTLLQDCQLYQKLNYKDHREVAVPSSL